MTIQSWSPTEELRAIEALITEHDLHKFEIVNLPNLKNASPEEIIEILSRLGAKLAFVELLLSDADSKKVMYEESAKMAINGYLAYTQIHGPKMSGKVLRDSMEADAYMTNETISGYKNMAVKYLVLYTRLEHIRNALQAVYNATSRCVTLISGEMERLR